MPIQFGPETALEFEPFFLQVYIKGGECKPIIRFDRELKKSSRLRAKLSAISEKYGHIFSLPYNQTSAKKVVWTTGIMPFWFNFRLDLIHSELTMCEQIAIFSVNQNMKV